MNAPIRGQLRDDAGEAVDLVEHGWDLVDEELLAVVQELADDVRELGPGDVATKVLVLERVLARRGLEDLGTTSVLYRSGPEHTCMPQTRTPRDRLVVLSHLAVWLAFFLAVASTPYCRVPILRSSTHDALSAPVKSSIRRNCSCRAGLDSRDGCRARERVRKASWDE